MAKMGRPLKYDNCLDLDGLCELYFESCIYETDEWGDILPEYKKRDDPLPFTITGLALALGTTRKSLIEYQERDDFVNTLKRHKATVENFAELRLFGNNAAGPIFALKNFKWTDRQDINLNAKHSVQTDDELDNEIKRLNGELNAGSD